MARPRIYDEPRVATAVRLPVSLHRELERAAVARDVSVNFLVTRAVAEHLARLPDVDAEREHTSRQPRSVRRVRTRST